MSRGMCVDNIQELTPSTMWVPRIVRFDGKYLPVESSHQPYLVFLEAVSLFDLELTK